MRKIKLTKIIISILTASLTLALSPIGASAEWRSNSNGWWYTADSSWAVGWKQIDGKWYYFKQDGYMEHNTTIDGYNLDTDGSWIQNTSGTYYIGTDLVPMNTQTSGNNGNGICRYSHTNKYSNDSIEDNLNNTYENFITLSCWTNNKSSNYIYTEIPLQKQYTKFKSLVGLTDDYEDDLKSADVKIYLDDKVAYSKKFKSGDMLDNIELDLTGKTKLKFALENIQCIGDTGHGEKLGLFNPQFIK